MKGFLAGLLMGTAFLVFAVIILTAQEASDHIHAAYVRYFQSA